MLFRFIPEAGEVRREVYGRSLNKTSRAETPINKGFSIKDGRSDGFFCLHLIYQDTVDPDFLFLVRWYFP